MQKITSKLALCLALTLALATCGKENKTTDSSKETKSQETKPQKTSPDCAKGSGKFGADCKPCTCVNGTCNDGQEGDGLCSSCEDGYTGTNRVLQFTNLYRRQ